MVTGGAPGAKVTPAIEMPFETGWATWPMIVVGSWLAALGGKACSANTVGRGTVLVPIIRPDEPTATGVP